VTRDCFCVEDGDARTENLIHAILDDVMLDAAMMPLPSSSDGVRT
jgi:hypothetical protein